MRESENSPSFPSFFSSFPFFLIFSPVLLNFCQFLRTFRSTGRILTECVLCNFDRRAMRNFAILRGGPKVPAEVHKGQSTARPEPRPARPRPVSAQTVLHLPALATVRGRHPGRPRRACRHRGCLSPRRAGARFRRSPAAPSALLPFLRLLQGARPCLRPPAQPAERNATRRAHGLSWHLSHFLRACRPLCPQSNLSRRGMHSCTVCGSRRGAPAFLPFAR